MGHERVGFLPKTRCWRDIVFQMSNSSLSSDAVPDIIDKTLEAVRQKYRTLHHEESISLAFKFLVVMAVALRAPEAQASLSMHGINLPHNPTPLSIARAVHQWMEDSAGSLEYKQIAQRSASDSIAQWLEQHKSPQQNLFGNLDNSLELLRQTSNGSGFCELSRHFFSNFTQGYLNYFLEREASSAIPDMKAREQFSKQIRNHIDKTSLLAFEMSKITQSFSAGWFNNNTKHGIPSNKQIQGFLSHALGKMREELRLEREDS